MKNGFVTIMLIVCAIMFSFACAMPANGELANRPMSYPLLTVIVNVEQAGTDYLFFCHDKNGEEWIFYEDENDWTVGDIVNLQMFNQGGDMLDDEIMEVYWEGHVDNVNAFIEMMGWR